MASSGDPDRGQRARPRASFSSASANRSRSTCPRNIKDVLVADPNITNASFEPSRRVYLIGSKSDRPASVFFDADGRQIASFDIAVTRDLIPWDLSHAAGTQARNPDCGYPNVQATRHLLPVWSAQRTLQIAGHRLKPACKRSKLTISAARLVGSTGPPTPPLSTVSSCASAIRCCSRSRSPKCSATWLSSLASILADPSVSCARASSTSTPTIRSRPAVSR